MRADPGGGRAEGPGPISGAAGGHGIDPVPARKAFDGDMQDGEDLLQRAAALPFGGQLRPVAVLDDLLRRGDRPGRGCQDPNRAGRRAAGLNRPS